MIPQESIESEEEVMRYAQSQDRLRRETDQWYVFKCIVAVFVIIVAFLIVHEIIRPRNNYKSHRMIQAMNNAKQISLCLLDFEADYGHFPDDRSAAKDAELSDFHGSFSNDYLGQLIAGGYTKSEEIFYAHNDHFRKGKPDDVISPPTEILMKYECGFAYVLVEDKGLRRGLSSKDNHDLPVLVAPLVNQWGSCDKTTFQKRGVYLRVDGAARSERLRSSDQKIQIGKRQTLFDTGSGTFWHSLTPVVLMPER